MISSGIKSIQVQLRLYQTNIAPSSSMELIAFSEAITFSKVWQSLQNPKLKAGVCCLILTQWVHVTCKPPPHFSIYFKLQDIIIRILPGSNSDMLRSKFCIVEIDSNKIN